MNEILKDPVLFFMALSIVIACTSMGNATVTALVYIVTTALIFLKDGGKSLQRRSLMLYFAFVAIVLIYSAFGKGTLSSRTLNMRIFAFINMFSVFMMSYHVKMLNSKQVKGLMIVAFFALLFSIIGTTAVSFVDPMAVRIYGFGDVEDVDFEIANRYRSMGMMGYGLAHGMSVVAVALSVLILQAKSKWLKIVSAIMLLLTIRLLFVMTITTALLLAVIGVAVVFANYFSKGRTFMTISLTVLIVAVFFLTGLSAIFLDFSGGANDEIYRKLADVFTSVESGTSEGQMGYRQELYSASIKTFLSNPILGWGSDNGSHLIIGDHSYFLDYLAYFGVFALLIFVAWWKEYKSMNLHLTKEFKSYYYYNFIPVAGFVAMKGASVCGTLPFMSLVFIQLIFRFLNDKDKSASTVK
ncbi:MAG: O-antigen ligase family protein [Bacteroidales bacterium]|nr:O-antigen ligase family protein [Bacteroidales bacterium]